MADLLPHREGDEHKGSCGFVAVVAGSVGMTGAAALTAEAALRAASGVEELGLHTGVTILVGAWCTSGSGAAKGEVYGLSVSVREP